MECYGEAMRRMKEATKLKKEIKTAGWHGDGLNSTGIDLSEFRHCKMCNKRLRSQQRTYCSNGCKLSDVKKWRGMIDQLHPPTPAYLAQLKRQRDEALRYKENLIIDISGQSGHGKELVRQMLEEIDNRGDIGG
jgi:RNA polymerase subunit RPABC4/transcription elongation factor Spt4